MRFEEIQREYDLTADDICAALEFFAELANQESFHPLPASSKISVLASDEFRRKILPFLA